MVHSPQISNVNETVISFSQKLVVFEMNFIWGIPNDFIYYDCNFGANIEYFFSNLACGKVGGRERKEM